MRKRGPFGEFHVRSRGLPGARGAVRAGFPCLLTLAALVTSANVPAAATPRPSSSASAGLPLVFAADRGRSPGDVRFVARRGGLRVRLTPEGLALGLAPARAENERGSLFLRLEPARARGLPRGIDRLPGVFHDLRGSDPSGWTTGIPIYRAVRYDEAWKGVDLVVGARGGQIHYDLVLSPGADVRSIRFRAEGARDLTLAPDGSLLASTRAGTVRQPPPTTWEEDPSGGRHAVACRYRLLDDRTFGFTLDARHEDRRVVIDPAIDYGSFLGGSFEDFPQAVAVDSAGAIYVAGVTWSPDFPVQSAFQPLLNGKGAPPRPTDAFVMKIDPSLAGPASLVWATFLGGSAADAAVALAIDESTGSPRATIAGWTDSADFPQTAAPHGPLGGRDAFLATIGPAGSTLDFSMEFGGSGDDWVYMGAGGGGGGGLALAPVVAVQPPVDGDGGSGDGPVPAICSVLSLAGMTTSADFPTTANAFDGTFNGGVDIFALTLDPSVPAVVYATYVGGAGRDFTTALASTCDPGTQRFFLYIAGRTHSPGFPMAANPSVVAFQPTFQGSALRPNGVFFVLEPLAAGANDLRYATFLGTSVEVLGLGVDSTGTAYLAGGTGPSFPQQGGMTTNLSPGGGGDGFLTLLFPGGGGPADLVCSTVVGGSDEDRCTGVLLDEARGWIYLAGRTASPSFPAVNAIQPWQAEPDVKGVPLSPVDPWERHDAFLTRIPLGSCASVDFSTFLGGQRTDEVFGMALDPAGDVWLTGPTHSTDFPTTAGAFETGFQGGLTDGFLVRIDPN